MNKTAIAKELIREHGLYTHSRAREIVYKRYFLYAQLRDDMTYQAIGELFGKDHASIVHGINIHKSWMAINDKVYLKYTKQIKEDYETKMMNGYADRDKILVQVDDFFQDVASINVRMRVNRDFLEKLYEVNTFQELYDVYLQTLE
jgi:hypothetical protein